MVPKILSKTASGYCDQEMEHKTLKVLAALVAVIVVLSFICLVIVVTLVLTEKDDSSTYSTKNTASSLFPLITSKLRVEYYISFFSLHSC